MKPRDKTIAEKFNTYHFASYKEMVIELLQRVCTVETNAMITKIEIDGFKTFNNFKIELSPFVIIAGANGSGKSNLFDAILLLSRLAETDPLPRCVGRTLRSGGPARRCW
jgi:energy-coupling factor transporter ATP-binding protein EcfA2